MSEITAAKEDGASWAEMFPDGRDIFYEGDDPALDCAEHGFIYSTGSVGCPDCRAALEAIEYVLSLDREPRREFMRYLQAKADALESV